MKAHDTRSLREIGYIANASGVSRKMIRYYESIGLIPLAKRTAANYRVYDTQDIQRLRLIKRARALGFSLQQIESLLCLWQDPSRASAQVKQLVLQHVTELDNTIREMQEMRETLQHLAQDCQGDSHPDCPILADLVQGEVV